MTDPWPSIRVPSGERVAGKPLTGRPMPPLTILHAGCHAPSLDLGAVRLASSLDPDSIGWSEAYERIPLLRSRVRYKVRVGRSRTDPRRGARDVPISRRRSHAEVDWWAIKACEASHPERIAPERWITGVAYRHPIGVVEHINLHPNAAVQHTDPDLDRVRKYADTMRRLESRIIRAQRLGRHVVVTGDLNWSGRTGPRWSPGRVFDRVDLRTWNVGLDWVAWSSHLRTTRGGLSIIGPDRTGQDHPWLLVGLKL